MSTVVGFRRYVDRVLSEQATRFSVGFATVVRKCGQVVGSKRFMNIDVSNRRVEIGSTWIVPFWQRTAMKLEAKYRMLCHAFEHWGCLRVVFKTGALNQQSRNAILRLVLATPP